MAAGRLMLKRIDDLIAARSGFSFETTGAIPEETIERCYKRSIHNLIHLCLPLVGKADIYNGKAAKDSKRQMIADKRGESFRIYLPEIWYNIEQIAKEEIDDARE